MTASGAGPGRSQSRSSGVLPEIFRCPQEKKRTLPFPSCLPPAVSCSPRLSSVFRVESWQMTNAMIGVGTLDLRTGWQVPASENAVKHALGRSRRRFGVRSTARIVGRTWTGGQNDRKILEPEGRSVTKKRGATHLMHASDVCGDSCLKIGHGGLNDRSCLGGSWLKDPSDILLKISLPCLTGHASR